MDYPVHKGTATPLGVSRSKRGINFALFSQHAEAVTLSLFHPDASHPFLEVPLGTSKFLMKYIWHVEVENLPLKFEYAYRVKGPFDPKKGHYFNDKNFLCDPYAKSVNTSSVWGEKQAAYSKKRLRGRVSLLPLFDWEGDSPPHIPWKDLIIYEMHIRAFTIGRASKVKYPGTYLGAIEKIPYLKKLGINAVELLPIYEFNECENDRINPETKKTLFNFWGYSPINFFSPMHRYAAEDTWHSALVEFKTLVKELHKAGMEVILDVVYNHTAEGNEKGPVLSLRGIDNAVYYLKDNKGAFLNYSGCGNTFSCNHPASQKLIVDSLRYWVSEMHVDGFRFDLASILTRGSDGAPLKKPPVIEAINKDPLLSKVKLIAEAWDCGGLYQVGSFPGHGRWAEWNGIYRDTVRRFIKGTDFQSGPFADVLSGSEGIYKKMKTPDHGVNFISAHDGYTLNDLVSYQQKHNLANGEENRDGTDHNESWNCGEEGATTRRNILRLRQRQLRNFHLALMLSLGIPMLLMGDEYGHTRFGNNNAWSQDNEYNWFQWNALKKNRSFFRFYTLCIQFRKNHPLLKREAFLTNKDIDWHGHKPFDPNWGAQNRFVAFTLKDSKKRPSLYVAFNAHFQEAAIELPPHGALRKWYRIIDTALLPPEDFMESPQESPPLTISYNMAPHSAFVMEAF